MGNVTSTVKLNMAAIRKLQEAQKKALAKAAEAVHTDVVQSQTMPRDTGALQNESTFVDTLNVGYGNVSIVSSTPYARRLYYHPEYHFQKTENPKAGGKWFAPYLKGGQKQDFAQEAFEKAMKREGGL